MSKKLLICGGTGCISSGSKKLKDKIDNELKNNPIDGLEIKFTGCHGFCEEGPIVALQPDNIFYCRVTPDKADLLLKSIRENFIAEDILYKDPRTGEKIKSRDEIGFYKKQMRLVLKNCGEIDPENIEEYIAGGGYEALKKVLSWDRWELIETIKKSGLRGRGGGGFSTGLKWEFTAKAAGKNKYVICNADEGDPGAFMDRSIIEGDPHSVIEGLLISAYAVGAEKGFFYIRGEYPLAVKRLEIAIRQAKRKGLLGKNICDSNFTCTFHIKQGAGAFVCGEETALIESLESNRGMPRPRPPYPAARGLWDKPTNINNVETLANIPLIIQMRVEEYTKIGTENSKGTKVFALTGKVKNTGLAEVPMGITLREIIFEIGGGISRDNNFKSVQIGGPSGGCLPESQLDLPIDYDSLLDAGAMMGSGGLVVMDDSTCMVDVAKYFLNFTQSESCGKCTPCREGIKRMHEILQSIVEGKGKKEHINLLENIAKSIKKSSLCGLGQSAPNPVLSTLRYFRGEYLAHIEKKTCPAGVCPDLTTYHVIPERCKGCGICANICPVNAITGEKKKPYQIDPEICEKCGLCFEKCPVDAIYKGNEIKNLEPLKQIH
jgi:NADH:ubiquinone oxidoreductase subunit F (NADH-binding)/(2Fe-2S) ferredoxin/Pyruvate/2-oxoacid:ferredoxin oxidoreductase delta subunit